MEASDEPFAGPRFAGRESSQETAGLERRGAHVRRHVEAGASDYVDRAFL